MHFPIVKHHHIFYILFGKIDLISGGFCHLSWPLPLGFSLHLLNTYFSFANAWVLIFIIYFHDILALIYFRCVANGSTISFVFPIGLSWAVHQIFPKSEIHLMNCF